MRFVLKLFVFVLVVGSFQSCVSQKKYDELTAAKEATDQALSETQGQLKTLQGEKDALAADLESTKTELNGKIDGMQSQLNMTKSEMAQVSEKLNMTQAELDKIKAQLNGMFGSFKDSGLSLEERDGRLYLLTAVPVNYRSGSTRLNKDQRDAVDALAETLKANPALKILVEGHTDNVGVKAEAGFNNWDLSIRRAQVIVQRLIRKGVDASQLSVAGRGEFSPKADNGSADGKAANRRSEIVPNPDLGKLIEN